VCVCVCMLVSYYRCVCTVLKHALAYCMSVSASVSVSVPVSVHVPVFCGVHVDWMCDLAADP
jgi:hypothetical protein